MTRSLVIDPGTQDCGTAAYESRVLARCASHKGGDGDILARCDVIVGDIARAYMLWDPEELVIEWPRVYKHQESNVNPDDLMWLVFLLGQVRRLFPNVPAKCVRRMFPADWKGQVPKKIMTGRIVSKLNPEEQRVLGKLSANHNVVDAVGIGLYHFARD